MTQPWDSIYSFENRLISNLIAAYLGSIFGCLEDIPTLCYGFCCTCCLFGRNAEMIDGSSCMGMCIGYLCLDLCLLCCLIHKDKRQQLRRAFDLAEEPSDFLATWILSPCAVCQEAREMKSRGQSFRTVFSTLEYFSSFLFSSRIRIRCTYPPHQSTSLTEITSD